MASTTLAPEQQSWSRFSEVEQKARATVRAALDDAAAGSSKVGDFYASCLDEAAIEKAGLAALKPLLARIQKVTAKSWAGVVGELHRRGVWVAWSDLAEIDLKQPARTVLTIAPTPLGLPERMYGGTADVAPVLAAYKAHVTRMLALAGVTRADAGADVLAIETELAKAIAAGGEPLADPVDVKRLGKHAKGIDWKAYFKALGGAPGRVGIAAPVYLAAVDRARATFKPAQWGAYFTYHLLKANALALPKAFDDEAFAFTRDPGTVAAKPERAERCVDATQADLGDLVGKLYIEKAVPAKSRASVSALVDALVGVLGDELAANAWLSAPAKKAAQTKLAALVRMIAYPDQWRGSDLVVKRDDFAGNRLRAAEADVKRRLAGKGIDRDEWVANTFDVNAYYNPFANSIAVLAGILQPPFFGADRAIAANMGGIGMMIAHELTHGFDEQGSQFDGSGKLASWWGASDRTGFETRGRCVAQQYSSFEAAPKQYIDGARTLGENIADLGGVKLAYTAYRKLRAGSAPLVADGFTEDQVFFLAAGQAWCTKMRPAEAQRRLAVDPFSPAKFRIYGALRNLPEFAKAFSCAPGTPMHPAQTCSIW